MTEPLCILFVCTANISRSPYLERRAASMIDPQVAVFSSGGTQNHPGRPMDPLMADLLVQRGGQPSGHVSKPVSPAQLQWASLVLTATSAHRQDLLNSRPDLARKLFTLAQFVEAAEAAGPTPDLIPAAFRMRGGPRASDDLADPYGLGAEAARTCAGAADAYLVRLAAVLNAGSAPPSA